MKMIPITLALVLGFSNVSGNAQIKYAKTETVSLNGNCIECEKIIEEAGSLKNFASVDWDQNTQTATLNYNADKTNRDAILKRIALVGFDNELYYAPDEVYNALPPCCRYQRNKSEATPVTTVKGMKSHSNHGMEMPMESHLAHTPKMDMDAHPLDPVFDAYFMLKDALVNTDGADASGNATVLLKALNEVKMESLDMESHMAWMKVKNELVQSAEQLTNTKDIDAQRDHFMGLSQNMYLLMKASKVETPIYYQFCPMANGGEGANWLSRNPEIRNPYYGAQMLSCGKTVETIK